MIPEKSDGDLPTSKEGMKTPNPFKDGFFKRRFKNVQNLSKSDICKSSICFVHVDICKEPKETSFFLCL